MKTKDEIEEAISIAVEDLVQRAIWSELNSKHDLRRAK